MYARLSSGHNQLAYNVDPRGAALTAVDKDGKRYAVEETGVGVGENAPAWQRAREIVPKTNAKTVDRRFNARVLEKHLAGSYSVAPASAGWVEWVCLDIDAHTKGGATDLVARRLARGQADRVLTLVWRAFGCSAERHPIVFRSPGGGYHVWFPLTREPSSLNAEHTWPAMVVRGWFERHLVEAGAEIALGVLEVFPSGRCLRAPCGRGMVLLRATRPNDPDALGLEPWPGTMATRVEWDAVRDQLVAPVRQVIPMVETFLAQWDAQRRTPADWMNRPAAAWDPTWGPLAYRDDEPVEGIGPHPESTPGGEKNSAVETEGLDTRPQQSDDSPHGAPPGLSAGPARKAGGKGGKGKGQRKAPGGRQPTGVGGAGDTEVRTTEEIIDTPAPEVDTPPDPAVDPLVRGRDFKKKKNELLLNGVTKPSSRHDAVLTLAFYWGGTCGHEIEHTLNLLSRWCGAFPHAGSRLSPDPEEFRKDCLYEARHYLENYRHRWRFLGRGDGGGLGVLTKADRTVLAEVDPKVRREAAVILAWLAGRADADGRIGEPVYLASKLRQRLCGDRRVSDLKGKEHRATVLAIAELERLGVLTLARNYCVGSRPRSWCCWYQFGSGLLPRVVEVPAAQWAEIKPGGYGIRPAVGLAVVPETRQNASSATPVQVRVVGERALPDGLVSVLSDGARGRPRVLVTMAADVGRPTAGDSPSERPAWFLRPYQVRQFTPAELWTASAATVTPFPDIEARRRMTRRELLEVAEWEARVGRAGLVPGKPAQVIPLRSAAPPVPSAPEPAAPPVQSESEAVTSLAPPSERELGAVADTAPKGLVDVVGTVRTYRKGDP